MDGTLIITGANGGLGSAIVSQIVRSPEYSKLYGIYAVRDTSTATALKAVLGGQTNGNNNYEILGLDLSQLADVRRFAAQINHQVAAGQLPPIRALVLNAGFQEHLAQTISKDGLDMSFQVNYLAHFLLTALLLQSMDKGKGRILVIGSWLHE
ncbi:hypothetical protein NQ176_g7432 [Zarea fungicola]|uniref:Uncharacterized protein n=1 Tax=Zarea fungicola TaxID=93591 RepID=A0ACC1MY68_9HYPO|nr:hypothetical protein NQ176_g7432 [Lecanicillium fungicola]